MTVQNTLDGGRADWRDRAPRPARGASMPAAYALPPPARDHDDAPAGRAIDGRRPRLLVAADGTDASRGALRLAALLAARDGATVHVATVIERWGPPAPVHDFVDVAGEQVMHRLSHVLPQTQAAFGGTRGWRVRVLDGGVVPEIAAGADAYDLVLVGLRSRWIDRLLRRPTALGIARHAPVPVLAVPPATDALPTRAVVGASRDGPAMRAARAAARVLGRSAGVLLLRMREDAPRDPARRLLAHARSRDADLVVVADGRPGSLRARLAGDPCRHLLHAARRCVLLVGDGTGSAPCAPARPAASLTADEGE